MVRCINLDWLEVHCLEPISEPHDLYWFANRGYVCNAREYGTPIYHEMFTILDGNGNPFIEVRRNPKSQLMAMNMCHIRLNNYWCYQDNAAEVMREFLRSNGYEFVRISRVDVCYDFERFDSGDNPQDFVIRYVNNVYSKINQSNLTAHGADRWDSRDWNSLSWGSPTSDVSTKMYDKTMELYDTVLKAYKKPYIRYAWQRAGLVDDWLAMTKTKPDGTTYTPRIWRVEFSIRSSRKRWFEIELDGHQRTRSGKQKHLQSIANTLEMWSKTNLIVMFAALAQHYFRFKYYEPGIRKDRCKDKQLFRWRKEEHIYTFGNDQVAKPTRAEKPVITLLNKIRAYRATHFDDEVRQACDVLIKCLESEQIRAEVNSPFSYEELQVLRQTIARKTRGDDRDAAILMNEIRALLKMNDDTCPIFNG